MNRLEDRQMDRDWLTDKRTEIVTQTNGQRLADRQMDSAW